MSVIMPLIPQFSKYLFRLFSRFLLQDGAKGLTTSTKVRYDPTPYNILNTCFDNFSYFIFQDGTKGLGTGSKIHVFTNALNTAVF